MTRVKCYNLYFVLTFYESTKQIDPFLYHIARDEKVKAFADIKDKLFQ